MALTDKLTSIADAIREKGGTTEKLTLDAMPTAIAALPTGGGGSLDDIVPNPIVIKSKNGYSFADNSWDWILQNYADRIDFTAVDSYGTLYMFQNTITEPPITVNFPIKTSGTTTVGGNGMFKNANVVIGETLMNSLSGKIKGVGDMFSNYQGETIPPITFDKTQKQSASSFISGCPNLKEVGTITGFTADPYCNNFLNGNPLVREFKFVDYDFSAVHNATSGYLGAVFSRDHSLRRIDPDFLRDMRIKTGNNHLTQTFQYCYALDEVVGLSPLSKTLTSNNFGSTFSSCYHLKRIIFDTQEGGIPYTVEWKNQTIELNKYVGWAGEANADKYITTSYNSGITADKEVVSQADYERLKDDPDWWSRQFVFSRFGHDAAVELINSLPDTEAYLVSQNASNNIVKFKTNAGNAIDGGGVNHLTEEEIAVAAAKGWTISYTD